MGFFSRLFGGGKVEPGLTHSTENGITDGMIIGRHDRRLGNPDGTPSVVDELGQATGGALNPLYRDGADMAVHVDIGASMESDVNRLEEAEERTWEVLGANPADVDGLIHHQAPGESAVDADVDAYEHDLDRRRQQLGGGEPTD